MDQVLATISLIIVLILVLPSFFKTNKNLNLFFKNFSIWGVIVIIVMIALYLIS